MTNIEKLEKAGQLVKEVFMEVEGIYQETSLNCALSDISNVKIQLEIKAEERPNHGC